MAAFLVVAVFDILRLLPAVHGQSCAAFHGLLCRVDVHKSLPIRLGFENREFTPKYGLEE